MITPCTDFSSEDNLSMSFCPIGFRVRVPLTKLLFFEIGRKLLDKKKWTKRCGQVSLYELLLDEKRTHLVT